ncbi:MAG: hypothetical protein R2752_18750 [Vicinamibacterales bacterium]
MADEEFAEGQIVEHKSWGRGKVVMIEPPYMTIQFPSLGSDPDAARRKLQLETTFVTVASVQTDPELDAIDTGPVVRKRGGRSSAPTLRRKAVNTNIDGAIDWFKTQYPAGFEDPKLATDETTSKREAHGLFTARFGQGRAAQAIAGGDLASISEGLTQVYGATNIPSVFEIRAIKNGLADAEAAGRLLSGIQGFLDETGAESFARLVESLGSLPTTGTSSRVVTWPNVTLVPFLADPARFNVLKPEASQKMAGRMGRDFLYSTAPSWPVYEEYQLLAADLLQLLRPLGAKDFIDVHAFMTVTRGLD